MSIVQLSLLAGPQLTSHHSGTIVLVLEYMSSLVHHSTISVEHYPNKTTECTTVTLHVVRYLWSTIIVGSILELLPSMVERVFCDLESGLRSLSFISSGAVHFS
jgi:hypothetical protein